jgi:hypothetical protein
MPTIAACHACTAPNRCTRERAEIGDEMSLRFSRIRLPRQLRLASDDHTLLILPDPLLRLPILHAHPTHSIMLRRNLTNTKLMSVMHACLCYSVCVVFRHSSTATDRVRSHRAYHATPCTQLGLQSSLPRIHIASRCIDEYVHSLLCSGTRLLKLGAVQIQVLKALGQRPLNVLLVRQPTAAGV